MSLPRYTSLAHVPRFVQKIPEYDGVDSKTFFYDPSTGSKIAINEITKAWNTYVGVIVPNLTVSSVSCGVQQLYGLQSYPPALTILRMLFLLIGGQRVSTYIFSDTEGVGRSGLSVPTSSPGLGLWTKTEYEKLFLKKVDPGQVIADIIEEHKGVLGSVVSTEGTLNRNTLNNIKTFLWTIPRKKNGREDFNLAAAIEAIQDWREANGATI